MRFFRKTKQKGSFNFISFHLVQVTTSLCVSLTEVKVWGWGSTRKLQRRHCGHNVTKRLRLKILTLQQTGHERRFACDFCPLQVETCSLSAMVPSRVTLAEGGRFIFSCGEGEKRDIVSPAGVGELRETEDTFTFKRPPSALPGIRRHGGEATGVDPVTATQQAAEEEGGSLPCHRRQTEMLCGFSFIVSHRRVRGIADALREGLWWCRSAVRCWRTAFHRSLLKNFPPKIFSQI